LRGIAFAALVALGGLLLRRAGGGPVVRADAREIDSALVHWSTRTAPAVAHLTFADAPSPVVRDWAAALRGAGTRVTWSARAPLPAVAAAVVPLADPRRPATVLVSAPAGSVIAVRDGLGEIDSVRVRAVGAAVTVPRTAGLVQVAVRGTAARVAPRDSLVLRRLLVVGDATWEAKFAVAALEEAGWAVDVEWSLAPRVTVIQGRSPKLPVDTARYAAVLAFDTVGAARAAEISAFVKSGGGFIAGGDAASGFAALLPARPGPLVPARRFDEDSVHPRRALALTPLIARSDVELVPLDIRPDATPGLAVAAWCVGRGRVVQVGYPETWRWRMHGADPDPVAAHRDWWGALVSGVAYAPPLPAPRAVGTDAMPLASVLAALGAPTSATISPWRAIDDPRLRAALFAVALAALLLEWGSRRARGAP